MAAKNPFPGMNPYLEQRWGDVHGSLTTYARDMLQECLPGDLRARMEERVYVESALSPESSYYPDVHVQEWPDAPPSPPAAHGATALAEPAVIAIPRIERRERYIQIIDPRTGGRVISMIEFLSPSNKRKGTGRDEYLKKQKETCETGVNLIEIDLLRTGLWTTLPAETLFAAGQRGTYHATVFRASRPDRIEFYAMGLRQRLPAVRVPLRLTDTDVPLDLQVLVNLAYERGGYDDIDYRRPLDPPLSAEDAEWVQSLLTSSGVE